MKKTIKCKYNKGWKDKNKCFQKRNKISINWINKEQKIFLMP